MGNFKILNIFTVYPELFFIITFLLIAIIITVYKVDKLEKQVYSLSKAFNEQQDSISNLKQKTEENEDELDIIDKYLNSHTKERISERTPIKSDKPKNTKVSDLLNPRKE